MLQVQVRGIKDAPKFREEDHDKINKLDLATYFDDFMKRRPHSKGGYISLAKENFKAMCLKAESQADFETLLNAYANYIGHRNILPNRYTDIMLTKALDRGQPETMLDMFRYHSELLYHPRPDITLQYFNFFVAKDYESLKAFFDVVKDN